MSLINPGKIGEKAKLPTKEQGGGFYRNAVLPQFMTWKNQVGATVSRLGFRVLARSTAAKQS